MRGNERKYKTEAKTKTRGERLRKEYKRQERGERKEGNFKASYFAWDSSLRANEHAPICIPQIIRDKRRAVAAGGSSEIRIVFCCKTRAT